MTQGNDLGERETGLYFVRYKAVAMIVFDMHPLIEMSGYNQ